VPGLLCRRYDVLNVLQTTDFAASSQTQGPLEGTRKSQNGEENSVKKSCKRKAVNAEF